MAFRYIVDRGEICEVRPIPWRTVASRLARWSSPIAKCHTRVSWDYQKVWGSRLIDEAG